MEKAITHGKGFTHTHAMLIQAAGVVGDAANVLASTMEDNGLDRPTGRSVSMEATSEAYVRIKKGVGSIHPAFRHGLVGLSRHNFVIVSKPASSAAKGAKKNSAEDKSDKQIITNVHAYPNRNYVAADMSAELSMPVGAEEAIVQIYKNGDIDVLAFPARFYRSLTSFISALEKLSTVDESTEFSIGSGKSKINVRASMVFGNRIHFLCMLDS